MSAEAIAALLQDVDTAEQGGHLLAAPRRFCFVAGTHIATLRGEMPVEQLREGDHIRAKKGSFHTITEVLVVDYDDLPPEAQAQIGLHPVKRGAIDEGLPRRDVYITAGQQFEISRRLEIAHAVRMTVRKEGAALRGFRFVLFACPGLSMIRAEGVWTTLTPVERAFPVLRPAAEEPAASPEPETDAALAEADAALPDPGAMLPEAVLPEPAPAQTAPVEPAPPDAAPRRRSTRPMSRLVAPLPVAEPEPPAPALEPEEPAPQTPSGIRAAVATRRATRRPVTRFLRSRE